MSWWGGEPLLEFDILKETKCYFESLNWASLGIKKSSFLYSITTNLTVLTDEILDFVVENNITLMVSLDGDKELIPRSSTMLDASQELNDFSAQMCRLGKMSEAELFNELSLKKQLYRMLRGIIDIGSTQHTRAH